MGTRNFAYDHPAYIAVQAAGMSIAAGSGASARFCAHADLIARAMVMKPAIAGTSSDVVTAYAVTGTTTKTLGVATFASAATAYQRIEFTAGSRTCTQGDEIRITKGTDATAAYAGSFEYTLTPGANVTD
jgi:hypothetical protein